MTFNSTVDGLDYKSPPPWFDVLRISSLSIVVFFIVSGNIFCFFVIQSSRQMRKVSRIFIVSLIVADLCAGLFSSGSLLATVAVGHLVPVDIAEGLCKAYFMGGILFNGGSFISLLTLICDCYIALEKPLRYPSLLTARRAYNIVWSFWILMVSVTVAYGVYFGTLPHHRSEWHWCLAGISPSKIEPYILLLLLYASGTVVLPLAVTFVLYGRIRLIVHRHKARLARITPPGHPSQQRSNETKSLTTFLMVNCGAALTSLPLSVLLVYSYWTREFSLYGISAAMIVRSCSNLLNVLVHTRRNGEFRSTVARVCGRNSRNARNNTGTASVANTRLSCIAPTIG
ncbi:alpha-1A adrenergic receptor-like [Patiria miniata]|uniref:G-protein coupled receptors family 1 profile domain-containing protein n=1 Tax=Patiria miniata TaxID=46514 RepID=A0A913ZRD8_PATMI|nr:alpha-1A adrenergic receptor-like [Patiria miniata]